MKYKISAELKEMIREVNRKCIADIAVEDDPAKEKLREIAQFIHDNFGCHREKTRSLVKLLGFDLPEVYDLDYVALQVVKVKTNIMGHCYKMGTLVIVLHKDRGIGTSNWRGKIRLGNHLGRDAEPVMVMDNVDKALKEFEVFEVVDRHEIEDICYQNPQLNKSMFIRLNDDGTEVTEEEEEEAVGQEVADTDEPL